MSSVLASAPAAQVTGLLADLNTAVDALLVLPQHALDDEALLDLLRGVERLRRRLPAVEHRAIVELEVRGTAAKHLQRSTSALLAAALRLDPAQARARVRAAETLGPRTAITGEAQEPLLPGTARGQARGEIGEEQARTIVRALHALPHDLEPELVRRGEADLAEHAAHLTPGELARTAERLVAHLDPDGSLTDDADRARRRELTIGRQGDDGMSPVRGLLDPTCRALLDAALSALARPVNDSAVPDPRTPGQRRHDALAAVCRAALAGGRLPGNRGLPATVVVTMSLDQLEGVASGWARTATGSRLPVADALVLASDARWSLALLDRRGQPLFLGRERRLASPAQRLALTARDGGCTRPGCDLPAAYCQVHHLVGWAEGGATDLSNLALVCDHDHRLITDEGYTVALGADGRITWTAPTHLDPTRTPRVNPLHHPPDLRVPEDPGRVSQSADRAPASAIPDPAGALVALALLRLAERAFVGAERPGCHRPAARR